MSTPNQPELPFLRNLTASNSAGEEGARMSFFEHLVELRKRIVHSAVAIGVGMMIGVGVANKVFGYLARPMVAALHARGFDDKLVYTSPTGAISLIINLGLYLGIVIASPYVLYQVWLFIAPGLYKHERRAMTTFVFSSVVLFLCGIAFGYFVSLPYVLKFLIGFQGPFKPLISINEYFDLILVVLLGLGIIFELPILIFCLSFFGIVTPKFLWKNIRYAVLIITLLAAIVTPTPDATTMVIFMTVMLALYFLGIGVSYFVIRNREKRLAAGEGTG
ncbi:MAG: twin-arginine translocase subunit TatC [Candidatus Acidiferrales bacterium]